MSALAAPPPAPPLCVDLDGTLVQSDLLVEGVMALLERNVLLAALLPVWLLRGKAHLKQQVADRVAIDPGLLPYHPALLAWLREERARGRALYLVTASHEKLARAVADHLGLFDGVLATDGETNLAGNRKGDQLSGRFGERGFDYAGNSRVDVAVWSRAREAIVVNASPAVAARAAGVSTVARTFAGGPTAVAWLRAMRLHQWVKNLLIFVPLAAAHRIGDPALLGRAALAFLAFSLCASSVYLLNDLVDLPSDRRHPTKRHRPLAAGTVPIVRATALIPVLLLLAAGVTALLPGEFAVALGLYYVMTLLYSLRLKRAALVDVIVLAGLYTLRIIAGGEVIGIPPSFWLLAFSMFLFLSLALVKRYTELLNLQDRDGPAPAGRGYRPTDIEMLVSFGIASGYMAVLVLALYINSEVVGRLYHHPQVLWLLCPLTLYVVSRIWLLARRDELHEDPVVFLIRDRRTQALGLVGGLLVWLAA